MCTALLIGCNNLAIPPFPPAFGLIYEGALGHPRLTTSLCNPLIFPTQFQRRQTLDVGFICQEKGKSLKTYIYNLVPTEQLFAGITLETARLYGNEICEQR
jgi:hypothetical protein